MKVAAILVLASAVAVAHSGGLDKNGGHYDRKTGEYHFHRDANLLVPEAALAQAPRAPAQKPARAAPPAEPEGPIEQQVRGKVVAVTDGDVIRILDARKRQWVVTLLGIDAPERIQPFGTKSRQALGEKILEKEVLVKWKGRDSTGRILGDVYLGDRHINLEMIQDGMAWHYTLHSKSKELGAAEEEARTEKRGLWADKDPERPWLYRKKESERKDTKPVAPP